MFPGNWHNGLYGIWKDENDALKVFFFFLVLQLVAVHTSKVHICVYADKEFADCSRELR